MLTYDRNRWRSHLFRLQGSVIPHIAPRLAVVVIVAVLLTVLVSIGRIKPLPLGVHTILGVALGLLLTFRTQTGYDRFWEGRKAWGGIVNRTRNLGRQLTMILSDKAERKDALALLIGFGHGLRLALHGDGRRDSVIAVLGETRAHAFEAEPGVPQWCLIELERVFIRLRADKRIDSVDYARLERDLTELTDQMGVCERIKKTPIPIAYVLHIRRFLALYCGTLPLALVEAVGYATPLVVLLVAYALFGIEQIGVEIEDPFEDAPNDIDLGAITRTIERDLTALGELENQT